MLVFIVTFCLFTLEALLHYNYGYGITSTEEIRFKFPEIREFIKIIITVFIFSFLNSRIIKYLQKYYPRS